MSAGTIDIALDIHDPPLLPAQGNIALEGLSREFALPDRTPMDLPSWPEIEIGVRPFCVAQDWRTGNHQQQRLTSGGRLRFVRLRRRQFGSCIEPARARRTAGGFALRIYPQLSIALRFFAKPPNTRPKCWAEALAYLRVMARRGHEPRLANQAPKSSAIGLCSPWGTGAITSTVLMKWHLGKVPAAVHHLISNLPLPGPLESAMLTSAQG